MQRSAVRAPVMSDVARLAGVSHQTVSRVINDHPNISPSTRAKVQRAIDQLRLLAIAPPACPSEP